MEIASYKYKKEVKDLTNELQEASSRLADMQDQVTSLKSQLRSGETPPSPDQTDLIDELQQKNKAERLALSEENDSLTQEISDLKNTVNELQNSNKRLQEELDALSGGDGIANWESQISEIIQWYVHSID